MVVEPAQVLVANAHTVQKLRAVAACAPADSKTMGGTIPASTAIPGPPSWAKSPLYARRGALIPRGGEGLESQRTRSREELTLRAELQNRGAGWKGLRPFLNDHRRRRS